MSPPATPSERSHSRRPDSQYEHGGILRMRMRRLAGLANQSVAAMTGYRFVEVGRGERVQIRHPAEKAYLASRDRFRDIYIAASLSQAMAFGAFHLGEKTVHPWVLGLRVAAATQDPIALKNLLRRYYNAVQPSSLAQWLGVHARELQEHHREAPPYANIWPWSRQTLDDELTRIGRIAKNENRRFGVAGGIEHGVKAFGPVSESRLQAQTQRLWDLWRSVESSGFRSEGSDYSLRGTFLLNGSEWVWVPRGATHRVAVASAARIGRLPVAVDEVVRREEVDLWPNVAGGTFTRRSALKIFDRVMAQRGPSITDNWIASEP